MLSYNQILQYHQFKVSFKLPKYLNVYRLLTGIVKTQATSHQGIQRNTLLSTYKILRLESNNRIRFFKDYILKK